VNLAARIAERAEPGKVLVSESLVVAPDPGTIVKTGRVP
jgi:class 3 adenylate cyclase